MSTIPHLSFNGSLENDAEFEHPPGVSLARVLEAHLRTRFKSVEPFENWRDCGWSINLQLNGKSFELYYALFQSEHSQWLLAVAPLGQPGFFARLFGSKPFECITELKSICEEVHSIVVKVPDLSEIRWFFGGPPDKVPSVVTPEQLPWA